MYSRRDRIIAFLMLTPSLILLAIFVYFFIGQTVYFSLTDWGNNPTEKPPLAENVDRDIIELENYERLMTDLLEFRFRNSLVNTFFFTLFFLAGCLVLGFLLAFLLDQRIVAEGVFRTIFLYPMSLSFVVTGTIWRWMFQPRGGLNVLPEKITNLTIDGNHIFPASWRLNPLDYSWLESRTTLWGFAWADVPQYLTYIGLALLFIAVFNTLLGDRWRSLGLISVLLVILRFMYALGMLPRWYTAQLFEDTIPNILTLIIIGLTLLAIVDFIRGSRDLSKLRLPGILLGIRLVIFLFYELEVYDTVFFRETLPETLTYVILALGGFSVFTAIQEERYRPVIYLGGAIALVYAAYQLGWWENIWLPLDTPLAETEKGYNAALSGIIIAAVWQMSGYVMALFLAGIRGVPEELREAARVDGCAEWQVYMHIIMPNLRAVALSAIIILGHISLKIFDLVFAMAGPDKGTTMVPGLLLYTDGFRGSQFAKGSAIAVVMLVLVSLVIIPYLYTNLRTERRA
jgi:ABC-type sugar transport system permease subunit